MISDKKYAQVALKAAKQSAPIFKKFFGNAGKAKSKKNNPRDLVTKVDLQIERQIRKAILQNFPNAKIIGEEYGQAKFGPNDDVWLIDPIDGTTNFIQGLPICCISIAVWKAGQPVLGVIYNPAANQLFFAEKGRGATLNGKKISVSGTSTMNDAFGGFGWGRDITWAKNNFPKILPKLKKIRTFGSTAMELCYIANGSCDFLIQGRIKVWDFAAAAIILTEAGGKLTDFFGKPAAFDSQSILASNGKIHKQLLAIIK